MADDSKPSKLTYFTSTSQDYYQQLYSLDVLGLEDTDEGDQRMIHQEFKEQLLRKSDGTYQKDYHGKKT